MLRAAKSLPLATLAVLLSANTPAEACDCGGETFRQYVKQATRVALVEVTKVDGKTVHARVLHRFKGKSAKTIRFKQDDNPLCGRPFSEKETTIVFVRSGVAGPCDGNYGLQYQLTELAAIAKAARQKVRKVRRDAAGGAIEAAMTSYFSGRATISVELPALAGKSFETKGTTLQFVRRPKQPNEEAIVVTRAIRVGTLTHVAGRYEREGATFTVLVAGSGKSASVIFSLVTET